MKFLVDRMLGKLSKKLRMLGYDVVYYRGDDPHALIHLAGREQRVVLTRNTRLIPRKEEDRIFMVTEDRPSLQLRELLRQKLISLDEKNFFSRCLVCNALLEEVLKAEVAGRVPEFIFHEQEAFVQCPRCRRIYWPGTHQKNMQKKIEELYT